MQKIRRSFVLVALAALMLLTSIIQAITTVVTKYPPYAYGEMYTERGGWLDSCKRIDRAEINKDTGYIYVVMWAKSIVYQAHYTLADFYVGNSHPDQSVYIPSTSTLSITVKFFFKGAIQTHLNTA